MEKVPMDITCNNSELFWTLGPQIIPLSPRRDARGFFLEGFQKERFEERGLPTTWAQQNFSYSLPGVVRGLHYQWNPPQGKLVGVASGAIWDVLLDLRKGSPTYGNFAGVRLDLEQPALIWIPPGFAHGFCVLGKEPAAVFYLVDTLYHSAGENGILWNDPDLQIPWPPLASVLSEKDRGLPRWKSYKEQPLFHLTASR